MHFSSLHYCKGKGGLPDFPVTFSPFIGTDHSYMQNKHVKKSYMIFNENRLQSYMISYMMKIWKRKTKTPAKSK